MQPIRGPVLVVVSYYDARPVAELERLLQQLATVPAGWPFAVRVVVNQDGAEPRAATLAVAARYPAVEVLHRPNAGYNIGAWDHGWRVDPAYDGYLFVQHECELLGPGWLRPFVAAANERGVGLVGERLNPAWAGSWSEMERRFAGHELPDHAIDGRPAERLQVYRHWFAAYGVDPGRSADHLQALVLFAARATLAAIGGLPHGDSYGAAIAAEIAISKKVEALGLTIREVGPRPFAHIGHPQWLGKARAQAPRPPRLGLEQWLQEARADGRYAGRPWLVLGKGPTFARCTAAHRAQHHTFALNHVVRAGPVTIAHVIDLDVVAACADALRANCEVLLMPRVPHVDSAPGTRALEELFGEYKVLDELDRAGRLVWYNLATAKPRPGSPVVTVERFSSEAAFEILGRLGARTVRTLGIDGGRRYSDAFADLAATTRLANGRLVFDEQFERLAATARRYGIDHAPLVPPLAVCIGGDDGLDVPAKVLEYTIRKHASAPVAIARAPSQAAAPAQAVFVPAASIALGDVAAAAADAGAAGADAAGPPADGWLRPLTERPWQVVDADDPWLDLFAEAVNAGVLTPAQVRRAVARGHASARLCRLPAPPAPGDRGAAGPAAQGEHRARCLARELANMRLSATFRLGRLFTAPLAAVMQRLRR